MSEIIAAPRCPQALRAGQWRRPRAPAPRNWAAPHGPEDMGGTGPAAPAAARGDTSYWDVDHATTAR